MPARAEGSCELLLRNRIDGYLSDSISGDYLLKCFILVFCTCFHFWRSYLFPIISFPIHTFSRAPFLRRTPRVILALVGSWCGFHHVRLGTSEQMHLDKLLFLNLLLRIAIGNRVSEFATLITSGLLRHEGESASFSVKPGFL